MTSSSPLSFCILGMQRTGSTFLHSILCQRRDSALLGYELWAEQFFGNFIKNWVHHDKYYAAAPYIWNALFQAHLDSESLDKFTPKFYGAKANFNSYSAIEKIVSGWSEGFHFIKPIGIIRSDQIAKLGSHMRAQRTGNWHQWTAVNDPGSKLSFKINLDSSVKIHIISSILADRKLKDFISGADGLLMSYEHDVLVDPKMCLRKIENFLGMEQFTYNFERHTKLAPLPEQYIINYAQLSDFTKSLEQKDSPELEFKYNKLRKKPRLKKYLKTIAASTSFSIRNNFFKSAISDGGAK